MIKRMLSLLIILLTICSFTDMAYSAKRKLRQHSVRTQEAKKADSHSYYKGLTEIQAKEADRIAQDIAKKVMAEKHLNTDLKKVRAASKIVTMYCNKCM